MADLAHTFRRNRIMLSFFWGYGYCLAVCGCGLGRRGRGDYTRYGKRGSGISDPDPFDPYLDESTPPSDYLPTKKAQYKIFHNAGVATMNDY